MNLSKLNKWPTKEETFLDYINRRKRKKQNLLTAQIRARGMAHGAQSGSTAQAETNNCDETGTDPKLVASSKPFQTLREKFFIPPLQTKSNNDTKLIFEKVAT